MATLAAPGSAAAQGSGAGFADMALANAATALAGLVPPGAAVLAAETVHERAELRLPTGPSAGLSAGLSAGPSQPGPAPVITATGSLSDRVWHVSGPALSPDALLVPLRASLAEEGFELLYECADTACGGFDFRYALDLAPEPVMHVDLGNYRYLAARRPTSGKAVAGTPGADDGAEYLRIVASRSAARGFVQITHAAAPPNALPPVPRASSKSPDAGAALGQAEGQTEGQTEGLASPETLGSRLAQDGRAVLPDVTFATGAMVPGPQADAALGALAAWLSQDPARHIALVGHTDNEGALAGNIALSRARAEAVRARLVSAFGVNPAQLDAEGVGWLSPLAPNDSAEGRARNRRVEAVMARGG